MQQPTLGQKVTLELIPRGAAQRLRNAQALDRDLLVEAQVVRAIHHAETTAPHHGIDLILPVEGGADPGEGIFGAFRHQHQHSTSRPPTESRLFPRFPPRSTAP